MTTSDIKLKYHSFVTITLLRSHFCIISSKVCKKPDYWVKFGIRPIIAKKSSKNLQKKNINYIQQKVYFIMSPCYVTLTFSWRVETAGRVVATATVAATMCETHACKSKTINNEGFGNATKQQKRHIGGPHRHVFAFPLSLKFSRQAPTLVEPTLACIMSTFIYEK